MHEHIVFDCPGCASIHMLPVTGPRAWGWNRDLERPTLTPSIFVNVGGSNPAEPICHSFVTDGKIRYLADCTHAMAGQTVDLPDVRDDAP